MGCDEIRSSQYEVFLPKLFNLCEYLYLAFWFTGNASDGGTDLMTPWGNNETNAKCGTFLYDN